MESGKKALIQFTRSSFTEMFQENLSRNSQFVVPLNLTFELNYLRVSAV